MVRIVVSSWMVRYSLGGYLSRPILWLRGFQRMGHDVYLVEKAHFPDSCRDPQMAQQAADQLGSEAGEPSCVKRAESAAMATTVQQAARDSFDLVLLEGAPTSRDLDDLYNLLLTYGLQTSAYDGFRFDPCSFLWNARLLEPQVHILCKY